MTAAPIVLGVDYSPCSLAAARHAARAARVGSRPLHVVRVIDDLVVFDMAEIARADAESIRADIRAYEGQALANLTSSIGAPPDVKHVVLVGALHEEIPRYLEAVGAELLVLGVRGIGGEGTGAGSFATSSVRRSTRPVLLVHDSAPERFRAVLACVDFSGSAVAVVHHAAEIAARDGARLDIMHAFDPPWKRLHYRAATPEAAPVFQQQFTAACESRLEALAAPIRSGAQKLAVRTALVEGSSHGRAIVEFAREAGSDLVVLGAHGRSRMLQTFLGTTAERVLRAVPCSMLVVRNA